MNYADALGVAGAMYIRREPACADAGEASTPRGPPAAPSDSEVHCGCSFFASPDGEVADVVAVAQTFDHALLDQPADRTDPQLLTILGGPADDDTRIAHWPDVDHELLMWQIVPPPDCLVLVLVTTGWAAPLDDDGGSRARQRACRAAPLATQ